MERNFYLREKLDKYHMFVHNLDSVDILTKYPPPNGKKWSVFIKVNCGDPRAGIWYEDDLIAEIATKITKECKEIIEFQGLYVHCGNTYKGNRLKKLKM